ncbi:MAG: ABC transporter ATP-binding protein [Bdellovibrio sp.]|nr:ABC transporter ATP-binding protein [Bdellovibrio sp.]
MQNALEFKNLKFSYGTTPVLDLKDFEVKSGEIVFLFGPSGSGKSTLLELIAGVLQVQSGDLKVLGESFAQKKSSGLDQFRADHIGYIFQSFNLIPYLSVTENLLLPLMFSNQELDQARFDKLVNELGLRPFLNRAVTDLSVGQQQRVAAARALLKKPKVILADEPTSALDYDHREKFLELLFHFCREDQTTVLFVSHDRTIEKLFDRSISLQALNSVHMKTEALV